MLTGFLIGDHGLGASGDTHPAWRAAYALAGPYLVVGASAIGRMHLRHRRPRDDAFIIRAAGPWLAIAVADGVGSRPLSRYGATYVAEALSTLVLRPLVHPLPATDEPPEPPTSPLRAQERCTSAAETEVEQHLLQGPDPLPDWADQATSEDTERPVGPPQAASLAWWPAHALTESQRPTCDHRELDLPKVLEDAFQKTHLGLREHARYLGLEPLDLSCTALALLLNLETGAGAAGQVGDGAILGLTIQGNVRELLQAPDPGDPQATYTLTRPDFQRYLAFCPVDPPPGDPFAAFYVMTDGLAEPLLYSPDQVKTSWARDVAHRLRTSRTPSHAAGDMLNWLATYPIQGSWDDRTLVVVVRKEGPHGHRHAPAEQPGTAHPPDH